MSPLRTVRLGAEFFGLYLVIPTLMAEYPRQLRGLLLPSLAVGGAVLFFVLWRDPAFDRRRLWNGAALKRWWWRVVLLVAGFVPVAIAIVLWVFPEKFLSFPRERPALWAAIMVGYPLASAYPQEIIFRTFLFHRYGELFRRGGWDRGALAIAEPVTSATNTEDRPSAMLIAASTAAFGYAHLMFESFLTLGLTVLGGFVFARTYARSRSTGTVAFEHALYGCVLFTVGFGEHFLLGARAG